MKKPWRALVAMMMATGLAFAAGDAEKPPAPPVPPSNAPTAPPHPADDFDPSRLAAQLKQNEEMIARWEQSLSTVRTDETKKVLTEAIAQAKEAQAGLEQLSDAVQAGKVSEARQLAAQLRENRLESLRYAAIVPTYLELDRAMTLQAERGADNPNLNARCQRIIDLLNKRLDLLTQLSAVNREISKERQALQQAIESAPDHAPAAEPPKPAPKPAAKPDAPT
jgi:hypothetical protein